MIPAVGNVAINKNLLSDVIEVKKVNLIRIQNLWGACEKREEVCHDRSCSNPGNLVVGLNANNVGSLIPSGRLTPVHRIRVNVEVIKAVRLIFSPSESTLRISTV